MTEHQLQLPRAIAHPASASGSGAPPIAQQRRGQAGNRRRGRCSDVRGAELRARPGSERARELDEPGADVVLVCVVCVVWSTRAEGGAKR